MEELNLQEIENKLNAVYADGQRLVFWYDADASFEDVVYTLKLEDVKIRHLTDNNAFRTKLLLEHDDPAGRYLVYAPFAKPDVRNNHLEDTLLYSKEFYADRLSLIAADIGLPDRLHSQISAISAFFGIGQKTTKVSIKRTNDFIEKCSNIDLQSSDGSIIPLIAMSVVAGARNVTVDDLMYSVFEYGDIEEQKIISEFSRFGLEGSFWDICHERFGFVTIPKNLMRFAMSLFATYTFRDSPDDMPKKWNSFRLSNTSNVNVLMDNMMNSVIYGGTFDMISDAAAAKLCAPDELRSVALDKLLYTSAFRVVDDMIINWITDRELAEDKNAKLGDRTIPEITLLRQNMHFGKDLDGEYAALDAGYRILQTVGISFPVDLKELIDEYQTEYFEYDRAYRNFLTAVDSVGDAACFEELKERIESIYHTEYLDKIVIAWNTAFAANGMHYTIPTQSHFYHDRIASAKSRVTVIISDAFRYEAAQDLVDILSADQNFEVKTNAMLGTLPSYTAVGMAALLPHEKLSMTEKYDVLLDDVPCASTAQREKILLKANPASAAADYDTVREMKKNELRAFTGQKDVIYIYHNKIDSTGEAAMTENDVMQSVTDAVTDIYSIIRHLSSSGNVTNFIITADHGFIYTRRKLDASDKLAADDRLAMGDSLSEEARKGNAFLDRRFIISREDLSGDGIYSENLGDVLGSDDDRNLMLAKGMCVFMAGGGMNYVHGGCSPQEMIIPCISVHAKKGFVETKDVQLILVSSISRITNLLVKLDFLQEEPVSDLVKPVDYRIRFEGEDGEIISNEIVYPASSTSDDPRDRMFSLRFDIKKKTYDKNKKYYLKVLNDKTGTTVMERQIIIDLPFTEDFGF